MGMIRCKYCGYLSWDLLEYVDHMKRHEEERDEGGQGIGTQAGQTPQTEVDEI